MAVELPNWAGNLAYRADSVHYPASVVEVQELVARLPRVKPSGPVTRSTPSPIPPGGRSSGCRSWRRSHHRRRGDDGVGDRGTRYRVLAAELQAQGYGLPTTGSLPHIWVAGATATGTHGSGDRHGILSTAVAAAELVTADGSLVTVDRSNPDLQASRSVSGPSASSPG